MNPDLAAGWAQLGVRPGSRPLSWAQLSGLSEFSDLSSPSQADRLAAELNGDRWLVADLLTPRPWLARPLPARPLPASPLPASPLLGPRPAGDLSGTLHAVLQGEWRGFVAQVGVVGPWLCVSGVSGVQALAARYVQLATAALGAREEVLQEAVAALWAAGRPESLLWRLAGVRPAAGAPRRRPLSGDLPLAALEDLFWAEAGAQAAARRAARAGPRWGGDRMEGG